MHAQKVRRRPRLPNENDNKDPLNIIKIEPNCQEWNADAIDIDNPEDFNLANAIHMAGIEKLVL